MPGPIDEEVSLEQAKAPLDQQIGQIATLVDYANNDVAAHNFTRRSPASSVSYGQAGTDLE